MFELLVEPLIAIDHQISLAVNGWSRDQPKLDLFVQGIAGMNLVKGGLFAALLWALWFRHGPDIEARRETLLRIIVGGALAVVLGRALQVGFPDRLRPLHSPDLDFVVPTFVNPNTYSNFSSFPSDHGVLFFALALGIAALDRRLGLFAFLWVAIVVCAPRVYLGYHFTTDILVGGVFGIAFMWLMLRTPLPRRLVGGVLYAEREYAPLFYSTAFLISWQMAVIGVDVRRLLSGLSLALGLDLRF